MPFPPDYAERVYAGVLGKIIGVYLGRPFEGWTYDRISEELGEVWYYVHKQLGTPLIVTDDDISGTFTFIRALEDYGYATSITAEQIGQTWLNYLIEKRTVLWWGGMGNSTEHTAYMRLKHGVPAPMSGSIGLNGKVVAEQIGAQIFIDGWAMVAPGDPQLAADLARRAGSVSHDGEAVYGAQVLAAMEAQAFVERDINALIDTGLSVIPKNCLIHQLINEIREWHAANPDDWRATRAKIAANYGYDKYGGNCHMVPNHALIIHALLHGEGDFQKSLMIVNTCGWDTDCNSGNLGCLLGIRGGLQAIDSAADFRTPVADRMYIASADGGRSITDAATEAIRLTNTAQRMAGLESTSFKNGARFHFEFAGSVQGFMADERSDAKGVATVTNVPGHSRLGERSLAIRFRRVAKGRTARVGTPTFIPSREIAETFEHRGYDLMASPMLHSGQTVNAEIEMDGLRELSARVNLFIAVYSSPDDQLSIIRSPAVELNAGERHPFTWHVPETHGEPIAQVGVEISSDTVANGILYLDYLSWDDTPTVFLGRPANHKHEGKRDASKRMWQRAWINGIDQYDLRWPEPFRLVQNEGRGLLSQGGNGWTDYEAASTMTLHMVRSAGLAICVQGTRRYYAILLTNDGMACLVKMVDEETVLAERAYEWSFGDTKKFSLGVEGNRVVAGIDGEPLFDVVDEDNPLLSGGVGFVVEEGRIMSDGIKVDSEVHDICLASGLLSR